MTNAPLPEVRVGDLWRFASHDRLRGTRFEETRRAIEIGAERIVCELGSTDPAFAAGRQWEGRATVANRATDTSNVHTYRARVLAAERLTVPAGTFDVLPVRFESTVASDDGQSQLSWRNVETLHYAPRANLFVRYEQAITGPEGRPAREVMLELLQYQPAR